MGAKRDDVGGSLGNKLNDAGVVAVKLLAVNLFDRGGRIPKFVSY